MERNKVMKAKCIHCGKEIYSLYKGQLEYNLKAHEISCPEIKKQRDNLKESDSPDTQEEENKNE